MAVQYQASDKGQRWVDLTVTTVGDITPAFTLVVNQNKLTTQKAILDALEQLKVRVLRDPFPA